MDDDDSTEDEDDLDAGMAGFHQSPPSSRHPPVDPRANASPIGTPPRKGMDVDAPQIGQASSPAAMVPPKAEPHARQTPDVPQRPGKLGRIGGRKAATPQSSPIAGTASPPPQPTQDIEMSDAPIVNVDPPTKRKLGRIGGARAAKPTTDAADATKAAFVADTTPTASQDPDSIVQSIEKPSPPKPSPKPAPPEKTMEEEDPKVKADRKREALKRKLHDSKTSGKPKRRF